MPLINEYGTNQLLGVVRNVQPLHTYWLDLCFPGEMQFETETIDIDQIEDSRHLAPFVSPLVEGKAIKPRGHTTRQVRPGYVKLRSAISPQRAIKRRPGEAYTGSLSLQQRYDAAVADMLVEFETRLARRMEWMAAQVAQTGQVTIVSEDYPSSLVDFQRDAGLTITLGSGARWVDAGVNPLDNLEEWGNLMLAKGAGGNYRVTMGIDAWKAFSKNPEVVKQLDTTVRGTTGTMDTAPAVYDGAVRRGSFGPFDIWTYNDWYHDDNNTVTPLLNSKDIVITSSAVNGVRCYGAIHDVEALAALRVFPKTWIENNPSALMLLVQSAPLTVPGNQNATLKARVLA